MEPAAAAAADRLALTQRLDMSVVDLPPEEPSLNLTQLVPELDLIGEKDKDKKDSDEEDEVRVEPRLEDQLTPDCWVRSRGAACTNVEFVFFCL